MAATLSKKELWGSAPKEDDGGPITPRRAAAAAAAAAREEHKVRTPRSAAAERAREAAAKAEAAAFGRVKGKQKSSGDLHEEWRRSSEGESVEWQAALPKKTREFLEKNQRRPGRAAYAEPPAAGPLVTVGAPTPAAVGDGGQAVILAEREEAAGERRRRRARRGAGAPVTPARAASRRPSLTMATGAVWWSESRLRAWVVACPSF